MTETVFASELIESVRLSMVSGVGPLLRKALLERFGSPTAVLAATKGELQGVEGIGPKISASNFFTSAPKTNLPCSPHALRKGFCSGATGLIWLSSVQFGIM